MHVCVHVCVCVHGGSLDQLFLISLHNVATYLYSNVYHIMHVESIYTHNDNIYL